MDARDVIRNYLERTSHNQNTLSERAGINRSILSKFLSGTAQLSFGSAFKLFNAMKANLTPEESGVFRQDTNLIDYV